MGCPRGKHNEIVTERVKGASAVEPASTGPNAGVSRGSPAPLTTEQPFLEWLTLISCTGRLAYTATPQTTQEPLYLKDAEIRLLTRLRARTHVERLGISQKFYNLIVQFRSPTYLKLIPTSTFRRHPQNKQKCFITRTRAHTNYIAVVTSWSLETALRFKWSRERKTMFFQVNVS